MTPCELIGLPRGPPGAQASWACTHLTSTEHACQLLASLDSTYRAGLLLTTPHDECPQVQALQSCHAHGCSVPPSP